MVLMGRRLLASVTDYLWHEAQECRTAFERDAFSLALAICGAVRRGDRDPVTSAAYACFGNSLPVYLRRRAERENMIYGEMRNVASQAAKNALAAKGVPRIDTGTASGKAGSQSGVGQPVGNQPTSDRSDTATAS
jgi:hypothetical protein